MENFSIETAAAVLVKTIVDHNGGLRNQLNSGVAGQTPKDFADILKPLFGEMLKMVKAEVK